MTLQPICINGYSICKIAEEASGFFVGQAWPRARIAKCNQANKARCSINSPSLCVEMGWVDREGPARSINGLETLVRRDDGLKVYLGSCENLGKQRIDLISTL
ncbi:hypothetical protein LCG56_28805 (plasmid) [Pseudomonas cannabina pv. alisalensis]|uniref:Uncharacterized protein n=1 Tax=Pseudomonas syringae pv. maculicola str. ES4326 TaxID=629265 RepID=A0A8T8CAQ1_PSEYM|nr:MULTISPECIES: hypothetical protein [Pseudomonas syringae group]QHF00397.1 hypothetical protein PMA4326_028160 [Pseudomonas syringae pv. maculicola str. ES4326]UBZ00370.1 hypothetical protein LCG56_28805 [Pseudomonas cannabina pv. alisalensis]